MSTILTAAGTRLTYGCPRFACCCITRRCMHHICCITSAASHLLQHLLICLGNVTTQEGLGGRVDKQPLCYAAPTLELRVSYTTGEIDADPEFVKGLPQHRLAHSTAQRPPAR